MSDKLQPLRHPEGDPRSGRIPSRGTAAVPARGTATVPAHGTATVAARGAAAARARGIAAAPYPVETGLRDSDRVAMALRAALERIVPPLARAAAGFVRARAWTLFGHARLEDHARERFGRSGRWVRDLAALQEAIEAMPPLAPALTGEDGGRPIGWVAALLIGHVATPASVHAWIERARSSSVRELREAVRRSRARGAACAREEPMSDAAAPAAAPADAPADAAVPAGAAAPDAAAPADAADPDDRVLVRLLVPAAVAGAFDEALDLHRAVEGYEATVTSFVEALIAEAFAGGAPPDADMTPMRRGPDEALRERALAGATRNWEHLPPPRAGSIRRVMARDRLECFAGLERRAGSGDAAALDRQIRELLALENELQAEAGRLLAEMGERGAWSRLMFAGVGHYAEERLRMSRTAAEDRARLARALRARPLLRAACETGRVGMEAALIVLRILGRGPIAPDLERAWVARAEEATVKRLRDEARALGVRGTRSPTAESAPAADPLSPADPLRPADPPSPADPRNPADPRSASGPASPLDDAEWHASLARSPGRSCSRIVRLGLLAAHAAGWGVGAGAPDDRRPPSPDVFLRLRLPTDLADGFLGAIESRRRALEVRADEVPRDEAWPDPAAPPSLLSARMFSIRSRLTPAWVGLLALLEEYVLTWDIPAAAGPEGRRRLKADAIYIRDGWRCTAPGCTSRRNLEDHHVRYRARGGCHAHGNRTCLCRFHHQRGEHGGLAACTGTAPLGLTWRLGRKDLGEFFRNERRVAAPMGPGGWATRRGGGGAGAAEPSSGSCSSGRA